MTDAPVSGAAPDPSAAPAGGAASTPSALTAPDPVAASPAVEPSKEGDPAKPAPVKAEDAPPAYAPDKLTLPEGMKADDPLLGRYNELMGGDLPPQERGQKLLDLYVDAVKTAREAGTQAWNDVNKAWTDKTMADPEIGGAKFPTTKATIAKAIDTLPADLAAGFREALDVTGAGNHPAVIKALHAFALQRTEGGHVTGAPAGASAKPSVKDAFYPNSPDMK